MHDHGPKAYPSHEGEVGSATVGDDIVDSAESLVRTLSCLRVRADLLVEDSDRASNSYYN